MTADIPLREAMLCWNNGFHGNVPGFAVVRHPDDAGKSDPYQSSVGACFSSWRDKDTRGQKLQLMIDAWHIVSFYDVPVGMVREGLLAIPEYRDMLASDCLPERFIAEREVQ